MASSWGGATRPGYRGKKSNKNKATGGAASVVSPGGGGGGGAIGGPAAASPTAKPGGSSAPPSGTGPKTGDPNSGSPGSVRNEALGHGSPADASAADLSGYDYSPSGFGKRFNPMSYGEMWENPDAVISEWFQGRGISHRGGAQATAMQWAPALGLHWMIGAGDDATKGTGHYLDFAGNYLNEMMKPGGNVLSPDQIIANLLNPQTDVLKEHLANADLTPAAQVENMRSAMRYGLANQMPTPVLQAMLAKLDQMGRDFIGNRATDSAHGDAPFSGYVGSRQFFGF